MSSDFKRCPETGCTVPAECHVCKERLECQPYRLSEGQFRERIRKMGLPEVCKAILLEFVGDAKNEFSELIQKPDINDYELGVPGEMEQYNHDFRLWVLFVKWFGEIENASKSHDSSKNAE